MPTETAEEKRVWELLVKNFEWAVPADHPVKVFDRRPGDGAVRLQIFEAVVTVILTEIRPEFVWQVTANQHDGGLDFIGTQKLLDDEALGISAAITVGGQCKKVSSMTTVMQAVSPSVLDMIDNHGPTCVVVALSAQVARERVDDAQAKLERRTNRQILILDRQQIEGLIRQNLSVVEEIVGRGLAGREAEEVLRYFAHDRDRSPLLAVVPTAPARVLAGEPFQVDVTVQSTLVSASAARIWWAPSRRSGRPAPVDLIGPIGVESPAGVALRSAGAGDEFFLARLSLEFVSHAVGRVDLGEILVGHEDDGPDDPWSRTAIGDVQVIENMRPRYYAKPFSAGMDRLVAAHDRVTAGGVEVVGVVGSGGSGKSRLCQEFALSQRRQGTSVVAARQTKTHDDPHRVLADLLFGLAGADLAPGDAPAETVLMAVSRYDRRLATEIGPAVRSLFGANNGQMAEQSLLSALVVLITARARHSPLIVHLQDLHWCTPDILKLLGQLIWQLEQVVRSRGWSSGGVLVVLEGRIRELQAGTLDSWSSAPFEDFLDRVDGERVACTALTPKEGLEFIRLLFEDLHHTDRIVSAELLDLQWALVEHINRTAGGSPFHSLQQVQLLKKRRVLGQNPETGLLYLIRLESDRSSLPESVFASIELRWQYLRERSPDLALLVWACSLLEDRIPRPLFRLLRSKLAPAVSVREVDATELLWTGDGAEHEVVFRHENYFEALRRFDVSSADRTRAVQVYDDWYAEIRSPGPIDRFRWARVLLEAPAADRARARSLFRTARRAAERQGDRALTRRISAAELDLAWEDDARASLPVERFLERCDQELSLSQELLTCDRTEAERRIGRLRERLRDRLASGRHRHGVVLARLRRRQLEGDVLLAQFLFDDQSPARATEIAGAVVRSIDHIRSASSGEADGWDVVEMEALHTYAVALAIGGELDRSIPFSARAVDIARTLTGEGAREVIGTHGNILVAVDTDVGVALLRDCLADSARYGAPDEADRVVIHLSIGQAVLAHRAAPTDPDRAQALRVEARSGLTPVVDACFRLGLYPDAGAASLMLGIIETLEGDHEQARAWFTQAVAAASRGRQLETLWKAHINVATALHDAKGAATQTVRDHALSALELMEASLTSPTPDRSPRFNLLQVPLAHAVRFLVLAGDDAGDQALERLPALRACFADPAAGTLFEDHGGISPGHCGSLRIGNADYVLY